jgi:hypothetical protein
MSLTTANAVIMFTLPGVFDTPQQLQGFMTDDVFGTEALHPTETARGVDGKLSGGFIFSDIKQNYSLMADSDSVDFFDQWYLSQQSLGETLTANATIVLTGLNKKWTMVKGFLKDYPITPEAKKIAGGVKFMVEWESAVVAPVS